MRPVALMFVVLITAAPLAHTWTVQDAEREPCPMAVSMPDGSSCLTAPCPCDHSAPIAVAAQLPATTIPRAVTCAAPIASARTRPAATFAAPASGFPFAVDHPPGASA